MIDLDKMIQQSGESNVRPLPKTNYPILKFNGKTSLWTKIVENEKNGQREIIKIEEPIEGIILKVRRSLEQFSKKDSLFTNEHNSWKEKIILFQSRQGKITKLDEGISEVLREKYQGLRTRQIVYFLFEGEVVKLIVKGVSLKEFFDYLREFEANEHLFQIKTLISSEEIQGEMGSYWTMKFKKGKKINETELKIVAEKLDKITQEIEQRKEYFTKKEEEKEQEKEENLDFSIPPSTEKRLKEEEEFFANYENMEEK